MFLKNKNIIFKIRRSEVTDYAALNLLQCCRSAIQLIGLLFNFRGQSGQHVALKLIILLNILF